MELKYIDSIWGNVSHHKTLEKTSLRDLKQRTDSETYFSMHYFMIQYRHA